MEYREIKNLLDQLSELKDRREDALIDNGGEITEDVLNIEKEIEGIVLKLLDDGIDDLGRWLYYLQSKEEMLKAEAASISAKRKANVASMDFILAMIDLILIKTERKKVKGTLYSFTEQISTTVSSDDEAIKNEYLQIAEKAIRDAGVPDYIKLSISGNVTAAKSLEEMPRFFRVTSKPRAKFTKPRKAAE